MIRDKIESLLQEKYPDIECHSAGYSCVEAEHWDLGFDSKVRPKASLEIHGVGKNPEGKVRIKAKIIENYYGERSEDGYSLEKNFGSGLYDGELPPEVIAAADHFVGAAA